MRLMVLGGTATARNVARALCRVGHQVWVSVASPEGRATVPEGCSVLEGRQDRHSWQTILRDLSIQGTVDCSHPFAVEATREFFAASEAMTLPHIALARDSLVHIIGAASKPDVLPEGCLLASDFSVAAALACDAVPSGKAVLLTVGVNPLSILVPTFRGRHQCLVVRILPTKMSFSRAQDAGILPQEIVAWWGVGTEKLNEALLEERNIGCVVAKDSGTEGGVALKWTLCRRMEIPLVLVRQPKLPSPSCLTVGALLERVASWKADDTGES